MKCELFIKVPIICVMLSKLMRVTRFRKLLFSSLSISKSTNMNLNKCYFRYIKAEAKVDISFLFKIKDSVRQFNFSRKSTERLESLTTRIGTNVQKISKNKKLKLNVDSAVVDVCFYDNINSPIPGDSTCIDLFSRKSPVKLKISDSLFDVVFNVPWIVSLNLPQSILAGFPVYPENFVAHYTIKSKCTFNWYKGKTINEKGNNIADAHVNWELVGNGSSYIPNVHDIGFKLKLECIPGNNETTGPVIESNSKNLIEAGPGTCPFETRHIFTNTKLVDKSFRCVSYNILADLYCDSDYTRTTLHPYCPPYALHIDYRKQLILKELLGYNADIMCLQEVDSKIFNNFLSPILTDEGFQSIFYKKGKEVAEGLACFYRCDRFSILDKHQILLSEALKNEKCLQPIWDAVKSNTALIERLLDRSTVASTTLLQSRDNPNEIIMVGNTHLYFHPDADHIRLLQGGIIIYWMKELRNQYMNQYPDKRISIILCGDFNSVPSCGIYRLYTMGEAPSDLPDWKSKPEEAVENLTLKQDIKLGSACGTPLYTNYTSGFADCLDYIFYDKNTLEVEQVIPFPSEEEIKAHIALPSIVFPSDHISLVSDLRFL